MKTHGYDCIAAWDRMMGSGTYYTERNVERAKAQNQPKDVVFEKGGYDADGKAIEGTWVRLKDVTSAQTQWYFKQNHPELVAKYTDWNEKEQVIDTTGS